MKGFIVGLIAVLSIGGFWFFSYVGVNDTEVSIKTKFDAQIDVNKNVYDNMFKKIAQAAQISKGNLERSKEAFKEIYIGMMKQRNEGNNGGALMQWVQESHPNFDMTATTSLYAKLMDIMESSRNEFTNEQNKLADIKRAHSLHCGTFMNKNLFFMADRDTLVAQYVRSTITDQSFETGKDDNIVLDI
jgi:hypothetical protein